MTRKQTVQRYHGKRFQAADAIGNLRNVTQELPKYLQGFIDTLETHIKLELKEKYNIKS